MTVSSLSVDGLRHRLIAHVRNKAPVEFIRGVVGGSRGEVVRLAQCLVQHMPLVRAGFLAVAHAPEQSLAGYARSVQRERYVLHQVHGEAVGRRHHDGAAGSLDLVDDHLEEVRCTRHDQIGDGGRLVHGEVMLHGQVADDSLQQRRQAAHRQVAIDAHVTTVAQLVLLHCQVTAVHGQVPVDECAKRLQRVREQVLEPCPAGTDTVLHGLLHPAPGTLGTEKDPLQECNHALCIVVIHLTQVPTAEQLGNAVHPCLDLVEAQSAPLKCAK